MKREYFSTNAPMIIGKQVHHRRRRRRARRPRLSRVARSGERQSGLALEHDAAAGRAGRRDLARRRRDGARRRHAVAAGHLRSRAEPLLLRHRQSAARCSPGKSRAGDNLYTCSIVALNPNTGKMAWYYQVTPHDTHDWDAAQTPVLIDGVIRRPAAQAARAGEPQRPLLPARSRHRRAPPDDEAHRLAELDEGDQREGAADPRSGEGRERAGHAGVARHERRDQLAAAELQPRHRPVLRRHARRRSACST